MTRFRSLKSEASRQEKLRRERRHNALIVAGVLILFLATAITCGIAVYRTMHNAH
jgi:hypothetical protein